MIQSMIGLSASLVAPRLMKQLKDQQVQVVHAMPGRVRLRSPNWQEEQIARALEENFSKYPIVRHVSASGITGSLLLEFTVESLTSEQFDEIVQSAVTTSTETYPYLDAKMKKSMRKGVNSINHLIKKQTGGKADFESLMIVGLVFKGATTFTTNPAFASSLLYWAYAILTKEGDDRL